MADHHTTILGRVIRLRYPTLYPHQRDGILASLPPYPSTSFVPMVTTPHPPTFAEMEAAQDPEDKPVSRGLQFIRLLKAAHRVKTNRRPRSVTDPHPKLVARAHVAADLLDKHHIPPAAWVLWTLDLWEELQKKKIPPASFVFGGKGFAVRVGWYELVRPEYTFTRATLHDLHRALLLDWEAAYARLLIAPQLPGMPDDLCRGWDRRVEAARVAATERNADLRRRALAGEWVW